MICAPGLQAMAQKVEELAAGDDLPAAITHIPALRRELDAFLHEVDGICPEAGGDESPCS
jgi:hypothetical protein